jgi:hypothetical protein
MSEADAIQTGEYSLTEDEVVLITREVEGQWRRLHWATVIALLTLFGVILLFADYDTEGSSNLVCAMGVLFAIPCAIILVYPSVHLRSVRQTYQRAVARGPALRCHHEFDEQIMTTVWTDGSAYGLPWSTLDVVVAGEQFLYLYFKRRRLLVIPWRAFRQREDVQRVYALLRANHLTIGLKHPRSRGWRMWSSQDESR